MDNTPAARVAEAAERRDRIARQMTELSERVGTREMTAGEAEKWNVLEAGAERAAQDYAVRVQEQADDMRDGVLSGRYGTERAGDASGRQRGPQNGSQRDNAMRLVEAATTSREYAIDTRSAERIESLTASPLGARWVKAGMSPAYTTAFFKALSGERGHLLWTAEEGAAYREVEAVRAELRSMGVTGAGTEGAFQVPTVIDPSLRIDTDGSLSPLRQLADVRRVIGQEFRPLTSAHVQSEWLGEHIEVDDHTETIDEHPIVGHRLSSFVTYSFEYESSGIPNFLGELNKLLLDGYDQLTAQSSWDGNGTTQPQGLFTGLAGGPSVDGVGAPGLDADVVPYAVQNSLPPRFQGNASWLANLSTINDLAQAETTNGSPRYPAVGDAKPVLLRKSLYEHSLQETDVLVYGDIRQAFTLVDFAGSFVERVPHPFGVQGRPTGDRGLLLWARHGSGVVIENAVRVYDGNAAGS